MERETECSSTEEIETKVLVTHLMMARGVAAFVANRDLEYETEDEAVELILRAVLGERLVLLL